MTRRRSSLGFLGLFGRSDDLRRLDQALRAADLHPALVAEGVKLTIVNLMRDHAADGEPPPEAYPPVAALIAYCVHGPEDFQRANGLARMEDTERRIAAAVSDGEGLDADLLLLTLHARLIRPDIVERYGLRVEDR